MNRRDLTEPYDQPGGHMTPDAHIAAIRDAAQKLAEAITAATAADVSQALILPELLAVFRESGLVPDNMTA